jgi:hypothetical protein
MMKKIILLLSLVLLTGLVISSCKKDTQTPIQSLFTSSTWQLASVMVFHYTGNSLISTDTLNTKCGLTQMFTFNKDNTCVYQNFDCITQTSASAKWSLSANQLFLSANVVCKDTTAAGSAMPFANAQIQNLGHYSLVLQTGDTQPNYSLTKPRRIVTYGFINKKALGPN